VLAERKVLRQFEQLGRAGVGSSLQRQQAADGVHRRGAQKLGQLLRGA
jgi:hypothetical protein